MANLEGMAMKYVVYKKSDLFNLPDSTQLGDIDKEIAKNKAKKYRTANREAGTDHFYDPTPNKYLVINTDEPYADEVIEIMKRHGHWG